MQPCDTQVFELAAIGRWSETLDDLATRIALRFRRVEVRERARRYLVGLLESNTWGMR